MSHRVGGAMSRCAFFMLLLVLGSGCQLLKHNSARDLGAGFAAALQGTSDIPIDTYLTADAEVFLQEASVPLAPEAFRDYLDNLRHSERSFRVASPVYLTPAGVGWLLDINQDGSALPTPTSANKLDTQAPLWMEASVRDDRISRVWIHFTRETLAVLGQPIESYPPAAAARGMPVPDGWLQGTPALIAAAQQTDKQLDASEGAPLMPFAVAGLVLIGGLGLTTLRIRRRARSADSSRGELLSQLAQRRRVHCVVSLSGGGATGGRTRTRSATKHVTFGTE